MVGSARTLAALLACCTVGLAGCSDDSTTASGDGSGGTGGTSDGPATNQTSDTSDDGNTSVASLPTTGADSSSTAPEPEFVPYPARGLRLSEVFANQGVGVPLVRDGAWVDGSGRNAALIRNRTTLFRGYWEPDADFEPREIRARLTIELPDGTEELAERDFFVDGPSQASDIDTNLYFAVPGELMPPNVKFRIELFETEYGYEDLPEPEQLAYPPEFEYVGVEDVDMALKVVIVPIAHTLNNRCPEAPEVTDEEMQYLADQLFMQNPVERVEFERHAVVDYPTSMNSFGPLLSFVADLRAADGADPAAYYYGVVRPCDGGPDGVGGQAISIPDFPTMDNAWTRVSVGRWYPGLSSTANTFVHEVGHTQGRRHIFCNGDEGGADPSYPYDAGDIGVWGFGVRDFTLHTPTNGKDYMTYCGNTWVSDWTWNKVFPIISEITSWSAQSPEAPSDSRLLVGLIDPATGEESWFTTPGKDEGRIVDGVDSMTFTLSDGTELQAEARFGPMGDGDAYAVVLPLPESVELSADLHIERTHLGVSTTVAAIRDHGAALALRQ